MTHQETTHVSILECHQYRVKSQVGQRVGRSHKNLDITRSQHTSLDQAGLWRRNMTDSVTFHRQGVMKKEAPNIRNWRLASCSPKHACPSQARAGASTQLLTQPTPVTTRTLQPVSAVMFALATMLVHTLINHGHHSATKRHLPTARNLQIRQA